MTPADNGGRGAADDILFGAVAVREGFVGAGQLEEALSEQRLAPSRRIGEILRAHGALTELQVQAILDIQRVTVADRAESSGRGHLFGQLALRRGFVMPDDVKEAVRRQGELAAEGRRVAIGQVLLQSGRLDAEHLCEVLRLQDRYTVRCPGCSRWYIVEGLGGGARLFCRGCLRVVPIPILPDVHPEAQDFADREAKEPPARVRGEQAEAHGHYVMEAELSRAHSRFAFRARHARTGRLVILHIIAAPAPLTPAQADAWRRAAAPLVALEHEHLAEFIEADVVDGRAHVVTEYVEARTHATTALRRPGDVVGKLRFLEQVARAIGHAHRLGIAHGALRNSAVMSGPDGVPRIIETGLAGLIASQPFLARDNERVNTCTAPEIVKGALPDARSDVYAIGVMVHETLAARPLYGGRSSTTLRDLIATTKPDPLPPEAPALWRAVVDRAMARRPASRYDDAIAMAEDMKAASEGRALAVRRRFPWPW